MNKNNNNNRNKPRNGRKNGAASRAEMRNRESASRAIANYDVAHGHSTDIIAKSDGPTRQANVIKREKLLKVIPIGGQDGIGAKNMVLFEYENDAIVVDAGFDLSVELPGINYLIPETTYLEKIKGKIRAYIITHGHLDHIGALPYVVPKVPAPIYGSRFTIGMVERQFEESDYTPQTVVMNQDNHEKLKFGAFFVELVRSTHAIPGNTMVHIETPVGRIVHTGDYRLDPDPLDHKPTDIERLKEIGNSGVTLLMGESTNAQKLGRTPTEHTLIDSFKDIFQHSPGRIFVATFSSNLNRVQMVVDNAIRTNRKVAIDGRSMLSTVEIAVRQGILKIPKGTLIAMREVGNLKDDNVVVVLTGSQGEENAALQRMSIGDHKYVKLKAKDTVILSSNPIPGNEVAYESLSDNLAELGVKLFRNKTHDVDGSGPLHVSGHGSRDEMAEVMNMIKPEYFAPIYAGRMHLKYHSDVAREQGIKPDRIQILNNGDVLNISEDKVWKQGTVPAGSVLIDQSGQVVPGIVVKDRLLMSEDGMVVLILTIDSRTGQLLSSPDIITRGFIYMRDNEELMNELRTELKRFALSKGIKGNVNDFKQELRDRVHSLLYSKTERSPVIIPVVNVVRPGKTDGNKGSREQRG